MTAAYKDSLRPYAVSERRVDYSATNFSHLLLSLALARRPNVVCSVPVKPSIRNLGLGRLALLVPGSGLVVYVTILCTCDSESRPEAEFMNTEQTIYRPIKSRVIYLVA